MIDHLPSAAHLGSVTENSTSLHKPYLGQHLSEEGEPRVVPRVCGLGPHITELGNSRWKESCESHPPFQNNIQKMGLDEGGKTPSKWVWISCRGRSKVNSGACHLSLDMDSETVYIEFLLSARLYSKWVLVFREKTRKQIRHFEILVRVPKKTK